ncbi:hypothetical protein BDR22DRAFT_908739 [Usnea florida]
MLSSARKAPSIVLSRLLWRRSQAQCYYPDSTSEPRDFVCNASAPVSLCCQNGETCFTNGLCFSQWDTSINTGTCTDKSWMSSTCFQQCLPSHDIDHGFHTLYRCNNDQWCCFTGGNTTSCCNDEGVNWFTMKDPAFIMGGNGVLPGLTIVPVESTQTSTYTAPSSASAISSAIDTGPTESPSSAAASNTTHTETPYPKDNTIFGLATKTGLGAGLGVGLPILAGLTVALLSLRRLRRQSNSKRTDSEKKTAGVIDNVELPAHHERQELESLPAEMPGSRRDITQEIGVDCEKKTAGVVDNVELPAHHERRELESLPAEMPGSRRDITQELGV